MLKICPTAMKTKYRYILIWSFIRTVLHQYRNWGYISFWFLKNPVTSQFSTKGFSRTSGWVRYQPKSEAVTCVTASLFGWDLAKPNVEKPTTKAPCLLINPSIEQLIRNQSVVKPCCNIIFPWKYLSSLLPFSITEISDILNQTKSDRGYD